MPHVTRGTSERKFVMWELWAIKENIMMDKFMKLNKQSEKKYGAKISLSSFASLEN